MMICEACGWGYPDSVPACVHCGAGTHIAHRQHIASMMDVECYHNYFLVRFGTGEVFKHPFDVVELERVLSRYTIVTFNGTHYDMPMVSIALTGASTETLKAASDDIIMNKMRSWEVVRRYCGVDLSWVDHIDLMPVLPGRDSLKAYGSKNHTRKLQDLPVAPDAYLTDAEQDITTEYCGNDLAVTAELFSMFSEQIQLRYDMSAEYGVDVRSKSDPQIAEAVMKSIVGNVKPPRINSGHQFNYEPPDWIAFSTLDILDTIRSSSFYINDSGHVELPAALANTIIKLGNSEYRLQIGGLHSTESCVNYQASATHVLRDHDVASYYPSLMIRLGIDLPHLGGQFARVYSDWYHTRLGAKRNKQKKKANSLKTLLNGTFGKLADKYSIFYSPTQMLNVTLTGQLALLMLIEQLEIRGISVISANTDGIVLYCPVELEPLADAIIEVWERVTQFETERTDYSAVYSRDVNSYIAIKTDGEVKCKGAFAESAPGPSGWPNPTGQVCVDAVVAYLKDSVPLAQTIRACDDIKRFVYVRNVKGGGSVTTTSMIEHKFKTADEYSICLGYKDAETLARSAGYIPYYGNSWKKANAEGDSSGTLLSVVKTEYRAFLKKQHLESARYLGKVVRWYYGKNSLSTIIYRTNGNLVPRSGGCVPVMELPNELPSDIDYTWYIEEAKNLLGVIGVK